MNNLELFKEYVFAEIEKNNIDMENYSDIFIDPNFLLDESFENIELQEEFGGEGQGDQIWYIFKVNLKNNIFYIRYDGTWVSWDGSYWSDDCYEVEPYQELVTKYKAVK